MKRIPLVVLGALTVWALAACSAQQTTDPNRAFVPTAETNAQLAAARAATSRYQDIDKALADGFKDINVFMPGMGHHFLNEARLDGTFVPSEPELLVYDLEKNGRYRLVAVEYAVPIPLSATAPDGFTGDADAWDRNTTFNLWTLHAWVWLENADGTFAPFNPRLQ